MLTEALSKVVLKLERGGMRPVQHRLTQTKVSTGLTEPLVFGSFAGIWRYCPIAVTPKVPATGPQTESVSTIDHRSTHALTPGVYSAAPS